MTQGDEMPRFAPPRAARALALIAVAALIVSGGCGGSRPTDDASAPLEDRYQALRQKAMAGVRAWQAAGGRGPDPRPAAADTLEAFAREHPGTEEAADALSGVLEMRAARYDPQGFFEAYDLMIGTAPNAAAVRGAFAQIPAMRLVEAGGPFIMQSPDQAAKRRAYRRAIPAIVADLQRAIDATTDPTTLAAAHYTIATACYQLESDPKRALEHFRIVAEKYPTWTYAPSAREYVRELEDLAIGRLAPDFTATGLRGQEVSLASMRGRIVLVDFWATWCQPCVDELPHLKRAYDRYKGQGFDIIGVNLDENLALVDQFLNLHRIGWTTIASGKGLSDPLVRLYSVQGIPMSYLVGRDGIIRGRALLGSDVEDAVAKLVRTR